MTITRTDLENYYGRSLIQELEDSAPEISVDDILSEINRTVSHVAAVLPPARAKLLLVDVAMYRLFASYNARTQQSVKIPKHLVQAYERYTRILEGWKGDFYAV